MNKKTRTLALTAILIAITLLLGLTPIGVIPLVPGFIEITIMCIPVIVGSLVLGWRSGLALGIIFGITTIFVAMTRSPLGALLLSESIVKTIVLLLVPRALVPITAYLAYRALPVKHDGVKIGMASAVGSLTNTVLFLTMLSGMFQSMVAAEVFTFAAFVNGSIETVLAVVVCVPVVRALKKSVPPLHQKSSKETLKA